MSERKEYELHLIQDVAESPSTGATYRVVTVGWFEDKLSEPREMRTLHYGRDAKKARASFYRHQREQPELKAVDRG